MEESHILELTTENSIYAFNLMARTMYTEEFLVAKGKRVGTKKTHIVVSPLTEPFYFGKVVRCRIGESFVLEGDAPLKTSRVLKIRIIKSELLRQVLDYKETTNISLDDDMVRRGVREYFDLI